MNNNNFSFTYWLASRKAVSFTLAIGIIFLISNYQGIVFRANPDNILPFAYPYPVQVLLSHLDSFFFGLATAIIIFQSQREWHKVVYCTFEGIMIFLNLNRDFLQGWGYDSQFLLASYIAVFSAFTLYYLGKLAKQHFRETGYPQQVDNSDIEEKEESRAINELMNEVDKMSYLKKYSKVVDDLNSGLSIQKTVRKHHISKSTVQNIKRAIETLKTAI
jgi:hypothetical protein